MDSISLSQLVADLLVVLAAGFVSGALCKRMGVSLLVGYLVVGAVIGNGGLGFVSQENHELEYLARAGALLLLFSVGIEFSLEELLRLSRYFFAGGAVQMLLVTVPLTIAGLVYGLTWKPALLAGAAGALSSTILVFKALAEWGQTATPHGRRAISILLFQDIALVPLMLLIPLLTGTGDDPTVATFSWLAGKSLLFVAAVVLFRRAIARWIVPMLAGLRSVELVVLFTLSVLGGACWGSHFIGLPPAIGALAAGLMLSGNRLSKQIDTLILPYRETFAAIFFVTLGMLLKPAALLDEPILLTFGLVSMLVLKSLAGTVALKMTGLNWKAAAGMGIGLAQLGEFSFLLVAEGVEQGIISSSDYNRMLFIAIGTLILTPQLIKLGLRWTDSDLSEGLDPSLSSPGIAEPIKKAIVIGIGPIGRQMASRIETFGIEVCLVDLSPINLHPFAQQGFHTVAGDASDPDVLRRANVDQCSFAVACVPKDDAAHQIVRTLRELNPNMFILVRCRFLSNVPAMTKTGADFVISEEQEASDALLRICEKVIRQGDQPRLSPLTKKTTNPQNGDAD
jgi:CPA2 family monovalent cation:H+ antiporter-2